MRELAREPMPGEIRLQWWRDVLGGTRTGEAGPVASALTATVIRYRLPIAALDDMIEARSFDLYDDPMGSLAELEAYADKTSSALMRLAAQILNEGTGAGPGSRRPGTPASPMRSRGSWLRFRSHAARRQLYVPLDVMQRHGARPEDAFAGIATPGLKAALAELREVARAHLAQVPVADDPGGADAGVPACRAGRADAQAAGAPCRRSVRAASVAAVAAAVAAVARGA